MKNYYFYLLFRQICFHLFFLSDPCCHFIPRIFQRIKSCSILRLPIRPLNVNHCLSWENWFLLWFDTRLSYAGLISFEYIFSRGKQGSCFMNKKHIWKFDAEENGKNDSNIRSITFSSFNAFASMFSTSWIHISFFMHKNRYFVIFCVVFRMPSNIENVKRKWTFDKHFPIIVLFSRVWN